MRWCDDAVALSVAVLCGEHTAERKVRDLTALWNFNGPEHDALASLFQRRVTVNDLIELLKEHRAARFRAQFRMLPLVVKTHILNLVFNPFCSVDSGYVPMELSPFPRRLPAPLAYVVNRCPGGFRLGEFSFLSRSEADAVRSCYVQTATERGYAGSVWHDDTWVLASTYAGMGHVCAVGCHCSPEPILFTFHEGGSNDYDRADSHDAAARMTAHECSQSMMYVDELLRDPNAQ